MKSCIINVGLITHKIGSGYPDYQMLENLYFQALQRNIENRIITVQLEIDSNNFTFLNSVLTWINA